MRYLVYPLPSWCYPLLVSSWNYFPELFLFPSTGCMLQVEKLIDTLGTTKYPISERCVTGKLHSKIPNIRKMRNRKTALQNHKLWSDEGFFFRRIWWWRFKVEIWTEEGQTDSKKMAHASVCDVSGATLQSCMVTRAIRNVHDQTESIRTRPAVANLLHPVEFKTIPHPQNSWCLAPVM